MTDLTAHLHRQAAFSRATFGPGPRTKGVIAHIKSEFEEIERCYQTDPDEARARTSLRHPEPTMTRQAPVSQQHMAAAGEWTDVAILGLDGLLRAIASAHPDWTFQKVAEEAVRRIIAKQCKNELRDWPNWRDASPDQPIEHDRSGDDYAPEGTEWMGYINVETMDIYEMQVDVNDLHHTRFREKRPAYQTKPGPWRKGLPDVQP